MTAQAPPLGVYIHWPYCARICPYCDFNVVRDRGRNDEQAELVSAIATDLEAQAALTGPHRLVSVYFGGGTPSLMDPEAVAGLIGLAKRLWASEPELEVTLEANPTDAEADRFAAFAAAGVNRLSLGVQALDDASLVFLGRNHDAATAARAALAAAKAFPRLSLDLIYALPGQAEAGWMDALDRAVDLGAEHLSPYQLTVEPGTAFDRAVRRGRFAPLDEDPAATLFEATQARLEALGFEAYEVSNHARGEAARSRHNLVYWRGQDYAGAGPGAHGRLTTEQGRIAIEADPSIRGYIARIRERGAGWRIREALGPVATAEERLLAGLRTVEGVAWRELAPLGLSPQTSRVQTAEELGLVVMTTDRLVATARGRQVLNRLIAKLVVE